MTNVQTGLEGVVVAETALSHVDGERGRLVFAGHSIESLAGTVPFEAVAGLLLDGALPDPARAREIQAELGRARAAMHERLGTLGDALDRSSAMDALRAGIGHLESRGDPRDDALDLAGAIAVTVAAWERRRSNAAPIPPDPTATHARDYLRLVTGEPPADTAVRTLDAYLVTVADHGMNASTFAARVVASTDSDPVSAVVAAIGALKGRLHGGAPGPVLDMLDAVGSPDRARDWLADELTAGRRIMGMGHRVYRVRDPRAFVLERAIETLAPTSAAIGARLALARAVERAAESLLRERHPDRPMGANVELYTALVLEAVGLPRELFTPTFAASRVIGWCAHVAEQKRTGRLIRRPRTTSARRRAEGRRRRAW